MQNGRNTSTSYTQHPKLQTEKTFLRSTFRNIVENESKLYLNIKAKPTSITKPVENNDITPILSKLSPEIEENTEELTKVSDDENIDNTVKLDPENPLRKWNFLEDEPEFFTKDLKRYENVKFVLDTKKIFTSIN